MKTLLFLAAGCLLVLSSQALAQRPQGPAASIFLYQPLLLHEAGSALLQSNTVARLAKLTAIKRARTAKTGVARPVLTSLGGPLPTSRSLSPRSAAFINVEPAGDRPINDIETQELESILSQTTAAISEIPGGPDAGLLRSSIHLALQDELQAFLSNRVDSAWAPGVALFLGRAAQLRSGYSQAITFYSQAYSATAGSGDPAARRINAQAAGSLAKLLALTGRLPQLDALFLDAPQRSAAVAGGSEWRWAIELRDWVRKHPDESYKCGLYCLDQLGRLTQPGQFRTKDITETHSTTNGLTAADLLDLGGRVGLRLHAALLNGPTNLPVPCILHLASEHFVVVRERVGGFYRVTDTVAFGTRWLTAAELAREATGCVLVSDALPPSNSQYLAAIGRDAAAQFRGRCHGPLPSDHDDTPCPTGCCPPGKGGAGGPGNGCTRCASADAPQRGERTWIGDPRANPQNTEHDVNQLHSPHGGMPNWFVSEVFANLWLEDFPLSYNSAFGPAAELVLRYHDRSTPSIISGSYWHGAQFGNLAGAYGAWSCSWLSFADLDSSEAQVDLMLPAGGWATFDFPTGSSVSDVNYLNNLFLEKLGPSGAITNLVLHYSDGSQATYATVDTNGTYNATVFYLSSRSDASGNKIRFAYDGNFCLTNVVAADSTSFAIASAPVTYGPNPVITNVAASYGATASFTYTSDRYTANNALSTIRDAAGLLSQITYESSDDGGMPTGLITPYGTTLFSTYGVGGSHYIFDRTVIITNANGSQEFYAQMNSYPGTDWPDWAASQIPTNTPIATLDTTERQERNTFYWNAQQFSPLIGKALADFTWSDLKRARIRHWLAEADPTYNHWSTLSSEQLPSPNGSTEGAIVWYDYVGKASGHDYERGTQVMPSAVASVMPDGTTAWDYLEHNSVGHPTLFAQKWVEAGVNHLRTNLFQYSADGVDLLAWTNAAGVRAIANIYNTHHQVITNIDALNQVTSFTYDPTTLQLTSTLRPSGLLTANIFDSNHRIQTNIDVQITRTNSYTWYSSGDVATHTDERRLTTTFFWDGLHRLTGTLDPRGTTTNFYHRLDNNPYPNSTGDTNILDLTATKDRLGHWTYFDFDPLRRKIAKTNATGAVTRWGYCDCGSVSSVTNAWHTPVEQVTTFDHDLQGNLTQTTCADGYAVQNTFDSLRRVTSTSDGASTRYFFYNNLSLRNAVSNDLGRAEFVIYDVLDRAITNIDINGVSIVASFDDLNRALTRTWPAGGVEKFGYSARGLIAYTNQVNLSNYFVLDEAGRKIWETNANFETLHFTYSPAGDLVTLTDGKNQTTTWNFDLYGRVSNKVDQASTVILVYAYDANDRLTNRWSREKGNTGYLYDDVGNLLKIDYPVSVDVTFGYDQLNRPTNMVDALGTTLYTYTAGNHVLTEDGPFASDTITNAYVNRLRTQLSLQQPAGFWTNGFTYDTGARLSNVVMSAGTFIYGYLPGLASKLATNLQLPNTSRITNGYDSSARLLQTALLTSGGSVLDRYAYIYDPANESTNLTRLDGSTVGFLYDKIGQLTVADSSVNTEDRGYLYDAAWNLNRRTNNGATTTFGVDSKNQLTSVGSLSCSYDSNGNLTNESSISGGMNYTYDDENRLIGVQPVAGLTMTTFVYDGLGRLRKQLQWTSSGGGGGESASLIDSPSDPGSDWTLSSGVLYIYDGWRVIQERDYNNTPTTTYTRGSDLSGSLEGAGGIGGLLARSSGYSSGTGNWSTHDYYFADGNGNIAYLVSSSQTLSAKYRYDPFGNTISSSGSIADANVYRFSSKEILVNSGLYYYGYRFYDPSLQRWLNRDPLGDVDGHNNYAFVHSNPITTTDPLGLITTPCGGARDALEEAQEEGEDELNNTGRMSNATVAAINKALADVARLCPDKPYPRTPPVQVPLPKGQPVWDPKQLPAPRCDLTIPYQTPAWNTPPVHYSSGLPQPDPGLTLLLGLGLAIGFAIYVPIILAE